MIFFAVIIFCVAIVQPSAHVRVRMTKAPKTLLDALDLNEVDLRTLSIRVPETWKKDLSMGKMNVRFSNGRQKYRLEFHARDSMLVSNKTPVYLAYRNAYKRGGVEYILQENAMNKFGQLMEDPFNKASAVFNIDGKGDLTFTAALGMTRSGSGVLITSKIKAPREKILKKSYSIDDNRIYDDHESHEVEDENDATNFIPMKVDFKKLKKGSLHSERIKLVEHIKGVKRAVYYDDASGEPIPGAVLYPKILLAADSSYYRNQSSADLMHSLEYLSVYFNTIDLYFRYLEDPAIKFHIAAIIIATSPAATLYVDRRTLRDNHQAFDQTEAIDNMSWHFYKVQGQLPVKYDIAFSLTGLQMTGNAKGISKDGGACSVYDVAVNGVILVRDGGQLNEMRTAIHELGRSIGLPDDTKTEWRVQGHRYVRSGFLMSPLNQSTFAPFFSDDSLGVLYEIVANGGLSCMYEEPVNDSVILPGVWPPKVKSLDERCRSLGKIGSCVEDGDDMCIRLRCVEPAKRWYGKSGRFCKTFNYPIAPGTPCKVKGDPRPAYCHHNRCVSV